VCWSAWICVYATRGVGTMRLTGRNIRSTVERAAESIDTGRYVLKLYVTWQHSSIDSSRREPARDLRRVSRGSVRPRSHRHLPTTGSSRGRADCRGADTRQKATPAAASARRRHVGSPASDRGARSRLPPPGRRIAFRGRNEH
jgi:hypothetical protein